MLERIVIVGAGHAGGATAIALRELGFSGSITLLGAEPHPPYERPSLSKGYLSGAEADLAWVTSLEQWEALGVSLRTGAAVTALDRQARQVRLAGDAVEDYDALVLATGGRVRTLDLPAHPAILYLRTPEDAHAIAAAARAGSRALVVGGGVIGLETASTLRGMGLSVTVVEAGDRLLGRNVPAEAAQWLAEAHVRKGVEIRMGRSVCGVDASGASLLAALDDGSTIAADFMVVGVGIIPDVKLAEAAELPVTGGILVDARYRSLGDDRIFAVGDVAARVGDGAPMRLETWAHAQSSARAAALAILGAAVEPEPAPWFWTDQCGHTLQILGDPSAAETVVPRGERVRLYLRESRLVGAVCLDQPRDFAAARRMMGKPIRIEAAADPTLDLRKAA